MLKIQNIKDKIGKTIYLPEEWHEKVAEKFNISEEKLPYQYEIIDDKLKYIQKVCLCEGSKDKKTVQILISDSVLKYLYGEEVPDSNIGFNFKEYLPLENTSILITGKNPSDVIPAKMELFVGMAEIEDKSYVFIDFILNYLNGVGFTTINYYFAYPRGTWKFLFSNDNSYMTDYEKMFQDTYIHKSFVKKSCKKLADYLRTQNMDYHADLLMKRAEVHDDSKVKCADELFALSTIINDKSSLKSATKALSQLKTDALKLHWKHNDHHPEHYKNVADMPRDAMMEMCCDWHARSTQYGTDLLEFVKIRQEDRFHFPKYMYDEIYHYCEILARD